MNALACILTLLAVSSNAVATTANVNPVTRVVTLLESLSKQAEKDGKTEEDLYDAFICWGKTTLEEKKASNVKANGKMRELSAYVADLESNAVTLTTEEADLTKDLAEISADIETATNLRTKEHGDYEVAKDEMQLASNALGDALDTLRVATGGKKTNTLISLHQDLQSGGMAALVKKQTNLRRAVEFGHRFLNKGDALFLQRVLLGDVPKVDWKKLNRKAGFKMAYKKRSGGIMEVLGKMDTTFKKNIAAADTKEGAAQTSHEAMMLTKNGQKTVTQQGLQDMVLENAGKDTAKQESNSEITSLTEQVRLGELFIVDTKKTMADKKLEWKARSLLRVNEVAAFSQAINILHNDDARDLMKKSFGSQGHFFLQTHQTSHRAVSATVLAAEALRKAAVGSGNHRLSSVADQLQVAPVNFAPIVASMDKMIVVLKSDEDKDLETKQRCEKDRMENTKAAINNGRRIDEHSIDITRRSEDIKGLNSEIQDLTATLAKVQEELESARQLRDKETAEWAATDLDDQKATEVVNTAKGVLEKFYADNKMTLALVAQKKTVKANAVAPPATWDASGYGGKTAESGGIISMLDMVITDMKKDRALAKAEEGKSRDEFRTFQDDTNKQVRQLRILLSEKDYMIHGEGEEVDSRAWVKTMRKGEEDELAGTVAAIERIAPDCEYYTVNYPLRRSNRQIELDGLRMAKTILNGGDFASAPDANREIKPGDAFLQKRK